MLRGMGGITSPKGVQNSHMETCYFINFMYVQFFHTRKQELHENHSKQGMTLLPAATDSNIKGPGQKCGICPPDCLVRSASEISQMTQAIANALGGPPEPDGKSLLLNITHFGHRTGRSHPGIDLEACLLHAVQLLQYWIALHVGPWGGGKSSTVLPSHEPCELQ